jgi:nicotinate-nucleotide adenylyltransferase
MRVWILGGSFNPVHWGHLHIALLAREAGRLDEVVFVPASRPPHKAGEDLAPAEDRLGLLEIALAPEEAVAIDTRELAPGGPRYTVDTLTAIARDRPGDEIAFILGADTLRELPTWRDPDRLLAAHRIIAVDRPGYAPLPEAEALRARCLWVEGNPFAISSSGIRRRVARGLSIRHLVPDGVAARIAERGLYRAAP